MQFTLCKHSALAMLRSLRSAGYFTIAPSATMPRDRTGKLQLSRTSILPPDPFPRKRWARSTFDNVDTGLEYSFSGETLNFAIPNMALRIRVKESTYTIYEEGIPQASFIRMSNNTDNCVIAISGPELLFAELAKEMHPMEHLMLGHELCGTFSRDALDPYNGPVTYHVKSVTSVERIRRFLDDARYIHGLDAARKSLERLNDNAWSPTESLITALLRLPMDDLGFDFGELMLNPRYSPKAPLPGEADSRVPDIMIAGTPVGLNYDGVNHLDLESIVSAARELEANPQYLKAQRTLSKAVKDVRAKAVDDIRRNRELAVDGLVVFPIVKEDLYTRGGFEQIVAYLISAIEKLTDRNMVSQKKILHMKRLENARRRMILSLMPGKQQGDTHVNRFICGNEVCDGPCVVNESWMEL